jgi:fucose permease
MTETNYKKVSMSMYFLMFAFSISTITLQVLMTNIIESFSLTGSSQAMLPSMFILGGMTAVALLPFIKGRITKAFMMSISSCIMAVMMFLLGFSASLFTAIVLCLILGVFSGWIDSYTNSTIVDINKTDSKKFVGYLHASFCIGAITLPFLIHFIMVLFDFDWRKICFVSAFIIAVFAIKFIITAKANREGINADSSEKKLTIREIKSFLRDKYYILMVLCYALFCLSQNSISIWLFHYTRTIYPNIEILASLTLSGFWLGGFFSRIFHHLIKVNPMKLFIYSISISIVAHVIAIISHSPSLLFIMTFIMSLTSGMGFPILVNETLTRYRGNTSMALTGLHFCGKLGAFSMPLIVGAIAAYNIRYAMLMNDVAAAFAVIVAIIILSLKDKRIIASQGAQIIKIENEN